MTDLLHERTRDALAAQERSQTVEEHLAGCEACRRFAASVHRVDAAVEAMAVPEVPGDLADRVLRTLDGEGASADTRHRRAVRRAWIGTSIAAAAAAVLIIVGVSTTGDDVDPERMALIAAAQAMEDERTASVEVEATVDVSVRREGAAPDFSQLPPEMTAHFEVAWSEMMATFDRSMAEFERAVEEMFGEIDRMLDGFGGGTREPSEPAPPHDPAEPALPHDPAEPAPPPDELTLEVQVRGSGFVDVDGRVELEGSVRPRPGSVPVPDAEVPFGLSVDRGSPVLRLPDGSVATVPRVDNALASLLARPDALPRLLRSARGDVVVAGEADVGGDRVTRYRFRAEGRDVEAWIGADDRLRRLSLHEAGADGQLSWRSHVRVGVTGYGVDIAATGSMQATPGATVPLPETSSQGMVHPFGPIVAEALRTGR